MNSNNFTLSILCTDALASSPKMGVAFTRNVLYQ